MRNILIIIFAGLSMALNAQKKITVADIYKNRTFSEASVRGINWMNAGQYYSALEGNDIVKYDITTGEIVETILDGDALNPKIDFSSYSFNADESKVLLLTERESIYRRSYTAEFYIYDFASKSLTKLSNNGKQSYATLSPDGTKVAFVRENNLFYVNLADGSEVQVTDDGKFNHIINGSTDWVYEEELSATRVFEWSGNNDLFYLTFDESGVREYNMQVWNKGQLYPTDYRFKYPKAGEDNSKLKATIYTLSTKAKKEIKVGEGEYYIARISQTPNADELSLIRLNRLQNKIDLLHVNTKTAEAKVILSETTDTYIDIDFVDDLTYLENGKSFIFASEKSGYKHLYWYGIDGKLKNQITSGSWEVDNFLGVDESSKTAKLYFTSTEYSPMDRLFYSVDINGKNKKPLRAEPGVHSINMSSDFKYYIDSHSSNEHPLHVNLYSTAK
ncbi:MAG: DPP IV N-terminal domain-containing protein, partial [Fulvivirga sp.]